MTKETKIPIFAFGRPRQTKALLSGDINADNVVRGLTKDNRICGLTNGAFSLISLIRSVLKITGSAHIIVST